MGEVTSVERADRKKKDHSGTSMKKVSPQGTHFFLCCPEILYATMKNFSRNRMEMMYVTRDTFLAFPVKTSIAV